VDGGGDVHRPAREYRPDAGGKMTTIPTYGSQPKPLGKFASVTEAARKLGVTRQEAKRILRGGK